MIVLDEVEEQTVDVVDVQHSEPSEPSLLNDILLLLNELPIAVLLPFTSESRPAVLFFAVLLGFLLSSILFIVIVDMFVVIYLRVEKIECS